jgi:membrane-associated phospholipid phosphatase
MNLTDRIYFAVHLALALLVCVRHDHVTHWLVYLAWDLASVVALLLLVRRQNEGPGWQFAHDWLPAIFFISVFEQVSFLTLVLRGSWQNEYIIALESRAFRVVPMEWMHARARNALIEFLEFGYFAFYPLYPSVGGLLWAWRQRHGYAGAFRRLTDTLSVGYGLCYSIYLLFPTQSPANRVGVQQIGSTHGGVFERAVRDIQDHAGVHGNAFPSAHIMLAFIVLVFAYRFLPRVAPWLLFPVLLMCVGAVYDGYHYTSDVLAGAVLGIGLGLIGILPQKQRPLANEGVGKLQPGKT